MEKEKLAVSACLLGINTRYDGGSRPLPEDIKSKLYDKYIILPICPEAAAGLPSPRPPSEIEPGFDGESVLNGKGRVFIRTGKDITAEFLSGADKVLNKVLSEKCGKVLMKEKSPSCGKRYIYDGYFSGVLKEGSGTAAALLKGKNIEVYSEEDISRLL